MNRRMIECNKCQECLNQKILLDFQNNADIMVIGLSARIKKYTVLHPVFCFPLSP